MVPEWLKGADRPKRARGWEPRRVITVSCEGPHYVHALTENPWAIWTHFREIPGVQRKTFMCTGDTCVCKQAQAMNKTWQGYLAVTGADLKSPGIIKISVAADQCLDRIRRATGSIMDVRLKLYRKPRFGKRAKKNDEVVIEADGPGVAENLRPQAFDGRPTVLLMFGYEPEHIDELLGY